MKILNAQIQIFISKNEWTIIIIKQISWETLENLLIKKVIDWFWNLMLLIADNKMDDYMFLWHTGTYIFGKEKKETFARNFSSVIIFKNKLNIRYIHWKTTPSKTRKIFFQGKQKKGHTETMKQCYYKRHFHIQEKKVPMNGLDFCQNSETFKFGSFFGPSDPLGLFFQKSGIITFFTLRLSKPMQNIRKKLINHFWDLALWTDRWMDVQNQFHRTLLLARQSKKVKIEQCRTKNSKS